MTTTPALDRRIARLLTAGTYLSIGLLAIGVVLMAIHGVSPLDPSPTFGLDRIPTDIVALKPEGFLWLGLLVTLATPLVRVAVSLHGYLVGGERRMAAVSVAILAVVTVGVVIGLGVAR